MTNKLNVDLLTKDMALAAKETFGKQWPEIREFAKTEMKLIAEGLVTIKILYASQQISRQQARLLIDMKKNAAEIIMLSVKGMSELMVEQAINAALDVIRTTVNKSLKFALL